MNIRKPFNVLLLVPLLVASTALPTFAEAEADSSVETKELPGLKGGPEKDVRSVSSVSMSTMQQRYPNVVVLHGPRNKKEIALTFDDGPSTRYTQKVLNILNKYNAKATFFLMGARAKALPHLVERIAAEGHAIGNHTYWHPNLTEGGVPQLDWEVKETNKVIKKITGRKTRLFRPPYGALNDKLAQRLKKMNMNAILWSVDSENWKEPPAKKMNKIVLNNTSAGDIILFHDAGDWRLDLSGTLKSLDTIIPKLQKRGYEFVTIPELLNTPEHFRKGS